MSTVKVSDVKEKAHCYSCKKVMTCVKLALYEAAAVLQELLEHIFEMFKQAFEQFAIPVSLSLTLEFVFKALIFMFLVYHVLLQLKTLFADVGTLSRWQSSSLHFPPISFNGTMFFHSPEKRRERITVMQRKNYS